MEHDRDGKPDVDIPSTGSVTMVGGTAGMVRWRRERKVRVMKPAKLAHSFGHIPGINIGTTWSSRTLCCRAQVHMHSRAGIHGSKYRGAYSIAVSSPHYGDKDQGDIIYYTGAGSRFKDYYGPQIHDQTWDGQGNRALRLSCSTGNPVRVIRGSKAVSDFAPTEGYRYDGLYTVIKAWIEKNDKNLDVCRFKLEASCLPDDRALTRG
ncbi:hypothetical protein AZE42_06288 [Rhizopogon vesiculosus]|uniref:YDG domain-containing protein n=1 Tax=Rhizopogon vesiculosus TaxID=180088 RepID=A0A1J8QZP3_9AGAM|nr:hypothetical protein AZE42_06288 [Rhizopogon vesiculosus]